MDIDSTPVIEYSSDEPLMSVSAVGSHSVANESVKNDRETR
jgi:hypothetical protein